MHDPITTQMIIGPISVNSALHQWPDVLLILCGSIMGSLKAHGMKSHRNTPLVLSVNKIGVGIFAGVAVALHYIHTFHVWGAAIAALVTSSTSVALIDALYKMVPEILNKLIAKWTGVSGFDMKDEAVEGSGMGDTGLSEGWEPNNQIDQIEEIG